MQQDAGFLRRHSLAVGLLLMFLFTWPIELANAGVLPFKPPLIVAIFVGYGFVFASILVTWLTLGRAGVTSLLQRYTAWRVAPRWYLLALFLLPATMLLAISLDSALAQTPIEFNKVIAFELFGRPANLALFVIPFLLIDALANGEEIGWRGFALPRLQVKSGALAASLMIGVIWSVWHIPKFLSHWDTVSFAWFVIGTLAQSVLLTWIYNSTKGSLLIVILFHASFNTASVFLPIANTVSDGHYRARIFTNLLTMAIVVLVVFIAGPENLSTAEPKQVQE